MHDSRNQCCTAWFRRHLKALFDCCQEDTTALWLVEEQRRLGQRIIQAGVSDKCQHLLEDMLDLPEEGAPFEVFVLGEGKFGKSTFINAVLGMPIAATDFLPKTWCFNRYIAKEAPSDKVKVFVSPDYGRRRPDLHRWLHQPIGESRGLLLFEVDRDTADALSQHEEQLFSELIDKLPHLDNLLHASPIMEMEWEVASDRAILPGIRLVDTQGINQMRRSRDHLHYLKWQFARADAVIWLISAEKINSSATRKELIEAQRYSKRIILVVNRWDKITDPERVGHLCEQLYAQYVTKIIYFSALGALFSVCPEVFTQLPGPAKADIIQMCKKHRLPNPLQAAQETAQRLRSLSGLDNLSQALNVQLAQKLRYIRNRTLYTTLRQQQREFYRIVRQTINDKSRNIQNYQQIVSLIREAQLDSQKAVETMISELYELLEQIDTRIESLTWECFNGDARALQSYLRLNDFVAQLPVSVDKVCVYCNERLRKAVVKIGEATLQYRDSEFDALGRVAFQQSYLGIGNISILVKPASLQAEIQVPIGFWHGVVERLKHTPVGPIIESILSSWIQRKRQECISSVKDSAQKMSKEARASVERLKQDFLTQIDNTSSQMMKSANECFSKVGDIQKLSEEIMRAEKALREPAVRCAFMLLLLRALKKIRRERIL